MDADVSRRTGFSMAATELIWERAQGLCEVAHHPVCTGRGVDLQHRRARGAGGTRRPDTNDVSSGVLVCRECHTYLETHPAIAADNGWRVRQNQTPLHEPVLRRGEWVLLNNDGSIEWEDLERNAMQCRVIGEECVAVVGGVCVTCGHQL